MVYLIIGGSTGIGRNVVERLSTAGKDVLVLSRTDNGVTDLPGVVHYDFDVTNPDRHYPEIETIEGFVYAPGSITLKPIRTLEINQIKDDMQLNVYGVIETIQQYYKQLRKNGASIVLFSTVAVQTGMAFHTSIAVAKAGVEALTRTLAAELAPKVRVNCVAPSTTDTTLAHDLIKDEEAKKRSAKRHPLQRIGQASDVGSLVNYLLSEDLKFITGQIIGVDGGLSAVQLFK